MQQEKIKPDIQIHPGHHQQGHGCMLVIEPLNVCSKQLVDDADGRVEHHFQNHHGTGKPDGHGEEEEYLIERSQFSISIGEQCSPQAND